MPHSSNTITPRLLRSGKEFHGHFLPPIQIATFKKIHNTQLNNNNNNSRSPPPPQKLKFQKLKIYSWNLPSTLVVPVRKPNNPVLSLLKVIPQNSNITLLDAELSSMFEHTTMVTWQSSKEIGPFISADSIQEWGMFQFDRSRILNNYTLARSYVEQFFLPSNNTRATNRFISMLVRRALEARSYQSGWRLSNYTMRNEFRRL